MVTRNYGAGAYGAGVYGKATTYQVAIDLGSYVLSGQVANFLQLHLARGALVLAGQGVSLLKGSQVVAADALYALSGATGLLFGRNLVSSRGNFGETGGTAAYSLGNIWAVAAPETANWTAATVSSDIWS